MKTNINPKEIYQRVEEFGLTNSTSMLAEIIETNKDTAKRQDAIRFLSLLSNNSNDIKNECFSIFENLLISDEQVDIKCEAAKALGNTKYEKGLNPLKWILKQKKVDNQIKLSALKAIHKIRFQDPEILLFINELESNYTSIKDYITIQLLSLNPENLVDLLLKSLKSNNFSNNHKTEIVKLIGYELSSINIAYEDISYIETKYPEIITNLFKNRYILLDVITLILREEDSDLIKSIITILKILGNEIEDDLIKLLLNDDFIVKKNAIILSGKLKLKNAVDLLITNLDNIYNEVSIASIEALGEIGEISAVPELLDILDIEDISFEYTDLDMKLYILDAIKKIYAHNKNNSYDYLFSYLRKDNETIKESIAFILGEIGKAAFVKPLVGLLEERNLDVKKNTIIALGKIGNIEPLEPLINVLKDKDSYWLIKKVVVDAIYNIFQRNWYRVKDNEEGIERLLKKNTANLIDHLKTEENENFKVKLSLIKFLENFGDKPALSALLKRINDFHRVVRIHASNAIKKIEEKLELENL
ncbi:MAG: HEAT repeat domain-containing protein [Promethearchaeota archaeon]